jgi:ATP-dependent helicase HrpB
LLAQLPVHPRIGRLLVDGHRLGHPERVTLAAALLSERDPFARTLDGSCQGDGQHCATTSDILDRVEGLEEYERRGHGQSGPGTLNRNAARFVLRARDQLLRTLPRSMPASSGSGVSADEALARSLLAAYPDRLARRRETGSRRGVMVGGRGVRLAPGSGVTGPELFLCIDVDAGQAETLVWRASSVDRAWLPAERLSSSVDVSFDAVAERVVAWKRLRFEDLVLEETPAVLPGDEETARVLAEAAAMHLERVLPGDDSPAGLYRQRVQCLRQWMPELELPPFDEADLRQLVAGLCYGRHSFAELRENAGRQWLEAFQGRLTYQQRQAVEREAPERLEVPSGSRVLLRYEVGRPPVLSVRIQEVFGLRETPRISGGRVRVLLHLLAPNFRPQQVTDDLASFWTNTYPQVRKELRARYPRHSWPLDPCSAAPERRPRRRHSE